MNEYSGSLWQAGHPSVLGEGNDFISNLHFPLETLYTGANSVVIYYTNQTGHRCGEILFFKNGRKCSVQLPTMPNGKLT